MKPEELARKIEIEVANRADGETLFDVLLRELKLSGLGAAVSASTQPRCPICHATDLTIYTSPSATVRVHCSDDQTHPAFYLDTVADCAQFFAAAPAQGLKVGEPCPTCERTYHGKMEPGEYGCATCGMGMVEPCEHWKAFEAAAAQEQPVENSPQPKRQLRCQSRQPHGEKAQCELPLGHKSPPNSPGFHLGGEYCWNDPPLSPQKGKP